MDIARRAESLARSANDLEGRAAAFLILGLALHDTGEPEQASRAWRKALDLSRKGDDPYVFYRTRNFLQDIGFPV
ncbi:hypothetical protein AB0J57_34225 [Streptomyces sp. NPDC049837]|uniref:hypothetical protein n=1 Tax=Streptomyces sp. NPDC049837 TaxID=3155277 RepID=UPI00343C2C43